MTTYYEFVACKTMKELHLFKRLIPFSIENRICTLKDAVLLPKPVNQWNCISYNWMCVSHHMSNTHFKSHVQVMFNQPLLDCFAKGCHVVSWCCWVNATLNINIVLVLNHLCCGLAIIFLFILDLVNSIAITTQVICTYLASYKVYQIP